MADLAKIKRNVAKMVAMNAPESDIDGYIASEGVTIDEVRNYQSVPNNVLGAVTAFDKGYTGGFGRKIGGLINAVGAAPVDALLGNKSLGKAFADRYREIVSPALKASEKFEGENPKTALALNIGGGIVSPINKLGAGYISKGASTFDKLIRSAGVGGGIGGVYGAGRTEDLDNLKENVVDDAQMGIALGVVAPLAIQGVKDAVSRFRPQNALAGKATGLEAAAKDGDSVKLLKRGIQADDAIASQIKGEAPVAMNSLNERMREVLNQLTGRKLDIKRANANQKERYDQFISKNADKELLNFSPTKEQIMNYSAESKYNLPKEPLSAGKAQNILTDRAKKSGIEIDGTLDHYTSNSGRRDTIRTLSNTLENPGIVFSVGNKGYVIKKYDIDGKPKFDFVTKKDGKLYNKFIPKSQNYIENQIKKSTNGASISDRVNDDYGRLMHKHITSNKNNIPNQRVVVNENLPRLSNYTYGLN